MVRNLFPKHLKRFIISLESVFAILLILIGAVFFIIFNFPIIDQSMTYFYSIPNSLSTMFITIGFLMIISIILSKSSIINSIKEAKILILFRVTALICGISGIFILFFGFVEMVVYSWFYEMTFLPIYTLALKILFLSSSAIFLCTSVLFMIKSMSKNALNQLKKNLKMALWQKHVFMLLLVGSIAFVFPDFIKNGIRSNFFTQMSFNEPAYELPSGSHFNSDLDDAIQVNQTLLYALEKGLWKMTTVRQAGGFPMYVEPNGYKYYGDRGESSPYFPGEFSMQESTGYIAGIYLKMYQLEPNPIYLTIAEDAARALMAVQDEINGGFYYDGRISPDGTAMQPHPLNPRRSAILDDNTMQSCMEFLLDLYNFTKNITYYDAIMKGFTCIDNMESSIGGWMQRSNYESDEYPHHITLNDNCLSRTFNLYLKAYDMFHEERFWAPLERAARFLINVQGNGGSDLQNGWAQQYTWDGMPAWARVFEPKAICSADTVDAIRVLITMYIRTGNITYLEPIDSAVDWLNDSSTKIKYKIGEIEYDGYSRLYELGTNKPIYGIAYGGEGRKPEYVYNITQARHGYEWQGDFGVSSLMNDILYFRSIAYDKDLMESYIHPTPNLSQLEFQAELAHDLQDDTGFWYNQKGKIQDSNFFYNAGAIINYLSLLLGI